MKKLTFVITCVFIFLIHENVCAQEKVRVACIGNSVTYGYGIKDREQNSYPAQLQKMLGDNYEVRNFGFSGATLLRKGHKPYWETEVFAQAKDFQAEIVIIHLGLNDTDPRNWPNYRDEFRKDYYELINTFRKLNKAGESKVWICRLSPIFHQHPRFKSGTRDWFWEIQNQIEQIALESKAGLIDFHTPLYSRPDLLPDALHPNAEGAKILAKTVYQEISGDFGGLALSDVYTDHMVLQRNKDIVISGTANFGDKIYVSLNNEKRSAIANRHGKWNVKLPAMKAGGPYKVKVETEYKTILLRDVLIGDVWLCSGQSNMAFKMEQCSTGKEDLAEANHSGIRFYNMKAIARTNAKKWEPEILEKVNSLDFFESKWESCTPKTASEFSAVAYYFAQNLTDSLQVPVGLILNAVGGSTTESWIDRKSLEHHPVMVNVLDNWLSNDFVQDWCRKRARQNLGEKIGSLQRHPFQPAYLYERGIAPLISFPIKGVIWYQGESNAHNVRFHEILFPELVQSWRKSWGYEFPFYYVQLSTLNRPTWGLFRDSQRRLSKRVPNSGMVVSSDLGHPTDVHPKNKKPIGERLARLALVKSYGFKMECCGPQPTKIQMGKGSAKITYSHAKQLIIKGGDDLIGFEISGKDGLFVPAKAKINGNTVLLKNKTIKEVKHVRYGWQAFNQANLENEAGLPASTFSTEYE